jgi:hypothetical protein
VDGPGTAQLVSLSKIFAACIQEAIAHSSQLRWHGVDLLGQIELSGRVCDLGVEIAQEIIATGPCGLPDSSPSIPCHVGAKPMIRIGAPSEVR